MHSCNCYFNAYSPALQVHFTRMENQITRISGEWANFFRAQIGRFYMSEFKLHSKYKSTGDQPEAIDALVKGFKEGNQFQTLLGVTDSGKTFAMENIIQKLNKPTLVIAHNKTLAAQLYDEFKEFFPENVVEYFVS